MQNTRILLAARPDGWVDDSHFTQDTQPVPEPGDGQILLRTIYLSVDPYMRGRMNDTKSYIPPFQIGEPLSGGVVAEVVHSNHADFAVGDTVIGLLDWAEYSVSNGEGLRKVHAGGHPLSYHLGILGMPGLTAYVGLVEVGRVQAGESVFVTAASGAVGSVVGQIARNMDCYVAGSAGSDAKVAHLKNTLGFNDAFNYKSVDSVHKTIAGLFPKGINVAFENVGGAQFEAAIWNMAVFGRIALCGMIADYNISRSEMPAGPRGMTNLIGRNVTLQGFIVSNYPQAAPAWDAQCREWLAAGKMTYDESVAEGIGAAPGAFVGMMKGENFGKQIVKVGDE
ncbi:MAG: NADP-dependent oxidoreductase [Pseudomonadota bacterium]